MFTVGLGVAIGLGYLRVAINNKIQFKGRVERENYLKLANVAHHQLKE